METLVGVVVTAALSAVVRFFEKRKMKKNINRVLEGKKVPEENE